MTFAVCIERSIVDGLGLLYSEEDLTKAISESRKILKRYKALKLREKLISEQNVLWGS